MGEAHVYTTGTTPQQSDEMLVDSGASVCLFNAEDMFTHVNPCRTSLHTASTISVDTGTGSGSDSDPVRTDPHGPIPDGTIFWTVSSCTGTDGPK